jgi:hypothetical protein
VAGPAVTALGGRGCGLSSTSRITRSRNPNGHKQFRADHSRARDVPNLVTVVNISLGQEILWDLLSEAMI